MKLETAPDMSEWREDDFALNCTYIVPDQMSDPSIGVPKAMTSIPRNLTFEYSTENEVRSLSEITLISISVKAPDLEPGGEHSTCSQPSGMFVY